MTLPGSGSVHCIYTSSGGVPKMPVGAARIAAHGVEGDRQARRGFHGGIYKAVSLYSLECLDALRAEGHQTVPGALGENLTIAGLDWEQMVPGVWMRVGAEVTLKITMYAVPCAQVAGVFADGDIRRIHHRTHPGWSRVYAQVVDAGRVGYGDAVAILQPDRRSAVDGGSGTAGG